MSVSATLRPHRLFLHYLTPVRGQDHSVTCMFTPIHKFSSHNIVVTSQVSLSTQTKSDKNITDLGLEFTTAVPFTQNASLDMKSL